MRNIASLIEDYAFKIFSYRSDLYYFYKKKKKLKKYIIWQFIYVDNVRKTCNDSTIYSCQGYYMYTYVGW